MTNAIESKVNRRGLPPIDDRDANGHFEAAVVDADIEMWDGFLLVTHRLRDF